MIKKEELPKFEYNFYKKTSDDKYVSLLKFRDSNGINEISYLEDAGKEVKIECNGKTEVAIDFGAENYSHHYFTTISSTGEKTINDLFLQIENQDNILYDNGIINNNKILGFSGVTNGSAYYEIADTFLRTFSYNATYNDATIYTKNKVDMTGYSVLKVEMSTGAYIGGSNYGMAMVIGNNVSSYPINDSTAIMSEKISDNNKSNIILTVDLSTVNEPLYIGLFGCMGENKFTKIWLE